jgi:(p)ppGpp synthase/HD superfamily hydrolase
MLLQITSFLASEGINIASINARTDREGAVFDIGFNIKNRTELDSIRNRMRRIPGVREVKRAVV